MEECDAFYVVRKGNMVAIYPSLSDCQDQVSSSVCDPAVGVYKSYSLHKETEEYLASRGLKNALYTIDARDVQEDLFGSLVPCCFQDVCRPSSSSMELPRNHIKLESLAVAQPTFQNHLKLGPSVEAQPISHNHDVCRLSSSSMGLPRNHIKLESLPVAQPTFQNHLKLGPFVEAQPISHNHDVCRLSSTSMELPRNHIKLESLAVAQPTFQNHLKLGPFVEAQPISHNHMLCILEFDGASKGNPGKAGAGAVLRTEDGRVVARLREGLGVVTNNVAEYRALILGLTYALKKGFKRIRAQGDSQLVCMQVQGLWQTKKQSLIELCKEVKELKKEFLSFEISHVKREFNTDADAQANLAISLPISKVYEERGEVF